MADPTWVNLPAEILFLVFLFVSQIPRDLMVCRGVCKRFREYLDSVDGIFWRQAISGAYDWDRPKQPPPRVLYLWKKGAYADPVASFLDAHHRNGPPFVKHIPLSFKNCLPGAFLVDDRSFTQAHEAKTLVEHLELESLPLDRWIGLYWDFFLLRVAAEVYPALNGSKATSYFRRFFPGDREEYLAGAQHFVLPVLLGPFVWVKPGEPKVTLDLLNSHLEDVLKSAGFPEILSPFYEAVVIASKHDFGVLAFDLGSNDMGLSRGEEPSKPFVIGLRHIYDDIGTVQFHFGYDNLFSSGDEFGRFHPPADCKDLFLEVIKGFPESARKVYKFLVESLGPLFSIRPRSDCEYETFVSLPRLHLFVSPFSGRLIGVHESFCRESFDD